MPVSIGVMGIRLLIIFIGIVLWHVTQRLLARRNTTDAGSSPLGITDGIHRITARLHQRLHRMPVRADLLLVVSSLVVDALGIYLIVAGIVGRTIEPIIGLLALFGLRQICQAFCPLPPPEGMIWRKPRFRVPTLFVTYDTANDLFFSGHTAVAVYGCATLAGALGAPGIAIGILLVTFEIWVVLTLRAHYTMDVFTGAITALYVHRVAIDFAPRVDEWIRLLVGA